MVGAQHTHCSPTHARPCFYRSIDPIRNCSLKVNLATIATATLPLLADFVGLDAAAAATAKKRRRALLPKPEVAVIPWGQRIFSPSEVLRFHYQEEAATPLEQAYHARVEQLIATPESEEARIVSAGTTRGAKRRLFTYTSADAYSPTVCYTTSPRELPLRAKDAATMRRPDPLKTQHNRVYTTADDVLSAGPVPRNEKCGWEEMHIMAYFEPAEENADGKENENSEAAPNGNAGISICLCSIRAYDSGLISITPGLNTNKTPHRITIGADIYEYTIKNASAAISEADVEAEWSIFQELYRQKRSVLEGIMPLAFTPLPPPAHARVHVSGQIVSAAGFRSTSLYIRHVLALPPDGWVADNDDSSAALTCTTQVAHAGRGVAARAAFGAPLEWVFVKKDKTRELPTLYLTVCSVDSWNRHRLEGYGYIRLPADHGPHDISVHTWRPLGTLLEQAREFFIGGSPELEDLEYITIPGGPGQRVVNKHALRVESSGSVRIRLNIVQQADVYQVKPTAGHDSHMHFAKGDLKAISDALARAKARVKALQASRTAE